MPVFQLLTNTVQHIRYIEKFLFLSNLSIKHKVHQQIPQFFFHFRHISGQDGVSQFVHLLYRQCPQGFHRLLFIPGTFHTQGGDDLQQLCESFFFLFQIFHTTFLSTIENSNPHLSMIFNDFYFSSNNLSSHSGKF